MSKTMKKFKKLIANINKLREKEKLMIESFEKSTGELSNIFHWIVNCELDGRHSCMLAISTCPTIYVKALEDIGFEIKEKRNCFDVLYGYEIYWE